MIKRDLQRIACLVLATFGAFALFSSPAIAQDEKAWSLDVGVDYASHYLFRGVPLLGDNEVLVPNATFSVGNFSVYYYGYRGDLPADFTSSGSEVAYNEDDFGAEYTFALSESFGLTIGAVSYIYSDRTSEEYDSADSYELYAIAAFDVLLAPTFSYYQDMDAIEGGFATFGVSHSYPMGEKASLDFSAAVSFDFGYNLGEGVAADYGLEESNGDLNDVLIGLDIPVQITDWFGFHVMAQQSIALDVLDDLEVDDETILTGGVTFSF